MTCGSYFLESLSLRGGCEFLGLNSEREEEEDELSLNLRVVRIFIIIFMLSNTNRQVRSGETGRIGNRSDYDKLIYSLKIYQINHNIVSNYLILYKI